MDDKNQNYDSLSVILGTEKGTDSKERRKKKDWVGRMTTVLSLISWVIMIAVWVVIDAAAPERVHTFTATFFQETFGTEIVVRTRWDYTLVYIAYVLMLLSLGSCIFAFIFNKLRMKRKSDKYKKSVFVIGGITVIAFIVFLIRFWNVLF